MKYRPRTGSIAHKVLGYFEANPKEELYLTDIAAKFDLDENHTGHIKEALSFGVAHEVFNCYETNDGYTAYSLMPGYGKKIRPSKAKKVAAVKVEEVKPVEVAQDVQLIEELTPINTQVGGTHYTKMAIQPMEFSMKNNLDACQHSIIKYVVRFRDKNGMEDLLKARHTLDMLIAYEEKLAAEKNTSIITQPARERMAKK